MAFQALEPVLRLATGAGLNEFSQSRLQGPLRFEAQVMNTGKHPISCGPRAVECRC
jgi:hypothetical protein